MSEKTLKEYDFSRVFCFVVAFISMVITFFLFIDNVNLRKMMAQNVRLNGAKDVDSESVPEFQSARKIIQYFEGEGEGLDQFLNLNPNDSDRKVLVYSAYWDHRPEHGCVRLITITKFENPPLIHCAFKTGFGPTGKLLHVEGKRLAILEHRQQPYAGQFVDCCFNEKYFSVFPKHVYVYIENDLSRGARVLIRKNGPLPFGRRESMALCLKPLHGYFNKALTFIEFLEYYRMMGVEHFFVYVVSVGPEVQRVLDKYTQDGVLTTLEWNLHGIKSGHHAEIRTYAVYTSLNECLYRVMGRYHYVVNVDFDEFIIPKVHNDLHEVMLKAAPLWAGPRNNLTRICYSGFVFKNQFFYRFKKDDPYFKPAGSLNASRQPYLVTRYKTTKSNFHYDYNHRSKYIAVAENVREMGNHYVYRSEPGCRMAHVPPNVVSLHHYRSTCPKAMSVCASRTYSVDRSAHRFVNDLLRRVIKKCKYFPQNVCFPN